MKTTSLDLSAYEAEIGTIVERFNIGALGTGGE